MPSRMLSDLISGGTSARMFFEYSFVNPNERLRAIQIAQSRTINSEALNQLESKHRGSSVECDRNLDLLKNSNAVVVITGQQLGLFGGPLLTLYKIVSAIKLADHLSQQSGYPVVPVYWLQTEDSDYDEISRARLYSQNGVATELALDVSENKLGDSLGILELTESDFKSAVLKFEEWATELRVKDEEVLNLFTRMYSSQKTLGESVGDLMRRLFARSGLLVFDVTPANIKEQLVEFIQKSFREHSDLATLLEQRSKELIDAGFGIQVPIRNSATLFAISHNGVRERLNVESSRFVGRAGSYDQATIMNLIASEPGRFTASALARPIMQDLLFPTAAYVAGPSEFEYWGQIAPLYKFFGITQPLVVPRSNFILVDQPTRRLLEKTGLAIEDVRASTQKLLERLLEHGGIDVNTQFSPLEKELQEKLNELEKHIIEIDSSLIKNLNKTRKHIKRGLDRFRSKYVRTLALKNTIHQSRIDRLKSALYPNDLPQDRGLALAQLLVLHGAALIDILKEELDLFSPSPKIVNI